MAGLGHEDRFRRLGLSVHCRFGLPTFDERVARVGCAVSGYSRDRD
jgi:hypothetical protein